MEEGGPPPANEIHGILPDENTVARRRGFDSQDVLSYLVEVVDHGQYLFIAPAYKAFRRAWGPRATTTLPVVADTPSGSSGTARSSACPCTSGEQASATPLPASANRNSLSLRKRALAGGPQRLVVRPPAADTLRSSNGFAHMAVAGMKTRSVRPPSDAI
ncbi:unnamed protein product, partial [Ectocarpus fasciculatus]